MFNISSILKWAAIIAVIALLGLTFSAFSDQGKLEATIAESAAIIERTNLELLKEKANSLLVIKVSKERAIKYKADTEFANAYKRRALYAERELSKLVSDGDTIAINIRLCETADRIEGNNADDRSTRCNANTTSSATSSSYYKIDSHSLENMLTNWERVASTIDQCFTLNKYTN